MNSPENPVTGAQQTPETPKDSEQQSDVDNLTKAHKTLNNFKPPKGWQPGEQVQGVLKNIQDEVRRIMSLKNPEPGVSLEEIRSFMTAHSFGYKDVAKCFGVSHTTVSRWMRGKAKMTPHDIRMARHVMGFTDEQLAAVLEEKPNA